MCWLNLRNISQKIRSEEPEVVRARTLHILPQWVHAVRRVSSSPAHMYHHVEFTYRNSGSVEQHIMAAASWLLSHVILSAPLGNHILSHARMVTGQQESVQTGMKWDEYWYQSVVCSSVRSFYWISLRWSFWWQDWDSHPKWVQTNCNHQLPKKKSDSEGSGLRLQD